MDDKNFKNRRLMAKRTDVIIAKFIGMQITDDGWYDAEEVLKLKYSVDNVFPRLLFEKSWDWLIPVVEKCYILNNEEAFEAFPDLCNLNIADTYEAVLKFIELYNKRKENGKS